MGLVQVDMNNRTQVRQFLRLPFDLHRDVPQWVPPLAPDARRMLDRRRHPFYRNSEAAIFLAVDDGCATGRVAVLENVDYNSVIEGGYHCADLVQIGLENDKMQRELQGLGIDFYKTHRVYRRLLW